jgi:hypothetical protein
MFMNRDDIEQAVEVLSRRKPEIAPYARFLDGWREVVDDNSDGWGTWRAGTACARRLSGLLTTSMDVVRGHKPEEDMPSKAMFNSSLAPIRGFATKKGLPVPELAAADPGAGAPAPGRR